MLANCVMRRPSLARRAPLDGAPASDRCHSEDTEAAAPSIPSARRYRRHLGRIHRPDRVPPLAVPAELRAWSARRSVGVGPALAEPDDVYGANGRARLIEAGRRPDTVRRPQPDRRRDCPRRRPTRSPRPRGTRGRPTTPSATSTSIPPTGLSSAEAQRRLERYGPNRLAEAPKEPRWRAFLRQFQDLLIIILLIAAVVSLLVSREWETPIAIAVVVLLNATIGFVQESKAEASLDALRQMSVMTGHGAPRRADRAIRRRELVPGDVVVVEAGDRVPADGRLLSATSLEIQESMLTGEAQPSAKSASAEVAEDAALGDRANTVYMNTAVTRGRGEVLVTATGMQTETGRIADMLHAAKPGPTPLQRQINTLSRTLAIIAGGVIVVVFVLGLIRGQEFGELFVSAVSLAVAAIPEGLPAVVAFTLAMGTGRLAKRGAIVKRLASVETLGSTSQICTDKTGTLTLNQMTARELLLAGRRFTISGEGYSTDGRIRTTDGSPPPGTLDEALLPMALCSDAVLRDGDIVGDPTEGALVVLAEKGGVDVAALRKERPRVLEIPFDSDYKFMATFHRLDRRAGPRGRAVLRQGRPGRAVRAGRPLSRRRPPSCRSTTPPGSATTRRTRTLAEQGMRVMAVGVEDFPADGLRPGGRSEGDARPPGAGRARRHRRPARARKPARPSRSAATPGSGCGCSPATTPSRPPPSPANWASPAGR